MAKASISPIVFWPALRNGLRVSSSSSGTSSSELNPGGMLAMSKAKRKGMTESEKCF